MTTSTDAPRPLSPVATLLVRVLVPGWIIAGAAFKLWERNPQLLPKPVTDVTDLVFVRMLGMARERYLDPAMRGMIAIELTAALAMIVGPPALARRGGITLLSLFCTILIVLLASGAASCGCFGASAFAAEAGFFPARPENASQPKPAALRWSIARRVSG